MSTKRDKRIDGEYDRPLPERIINPTKNDKEKLQAVLAKYDKSKNKQIK